MKKKKNKKIDNKLYFFFTLIFLLLLSFSTFYAFYAISLLKGIEDLIRSFLTIIITVIFIYFIFKAYKTLKKNSFKATIKLVLIIIIYSVILGSLSIVVDNTYGRIKKISNNFTSYSTSLVTLIDNKTNSITKLEDKEIGIIDDKESIDGYILPNEVIKEYSLK
jgi:predicted PurR-regulated permease PerM